jgi:hypothetical protein
VSSYEWGQIFGGVVLPAGLAAATLWSGFRARRRGESGTLLLVAGAVLSIVFLVGVIRTAGDL